MALLAGAAYWLIHASVDWLWQMAGVSIPALLFVAAGVAGTDARVGALWPRVRQWLSLEKKANAARTPTTPVVPERAAPSQLATGPRHRRRILRHSLLERDQPHELLSALFRMLLLVLSLVVIVTAGLPYLSLQLQKSAAALAGTDGVRAVKRAGSAQFLVPNDPRPYVTQAGIYSRAASAAAASPAGDRAGAVLDNLALSIERLEAAIAREPADWSLHYRAGVTTLNLLLVRAYSDGVELQLDYASLIPLIPGLEDWSGLADSADPMPKPGAAEGSLAADASSLGTAQHARESSLEGLAKKAEDFLTAAQERNPPATEPAAALYVVRQVIGH